MRWLTYFMISASNQQLQYQLEYTPQNPDCHSWGISKMQSDTLEEWYAIKFGFKLGKMIPQKRMECFRLLFDHLAWIEHQFLSGIRDLRKPGSLWQMMRGVGGVRKSIHLRWSAKNLGLGLGLLCWGFNGVQEENPSEEASTLEIGSVAFPPGQCTSPQLHSCHRLFEQGGHQDSSSPCLQSRRCSLWHAHTRGLLLGLPEVVGTVQVHCSRRRLFRDYFEFHVCTINKNAHT